MRTPLLAAALVALSLAACQSRAPRPGSRTPAYRRPVPAAPEPTLVAGTLLDHRGPRPVSFEEMADRLATAAVVHVGEDHDQAHHHAFQARVFGALVARWEGKPVAIGLEMFSRPFQPALDAYVRREIDEAEMLKRTEWATRWGFGWEMYAPMLRLARERGIPVIALNAEKEVTRTVSRGGLEALTPEQRAALPPLDVNDAGHRAFVKEAFGAHGASMPAERFERFYTAMVIWDEVMSSSVASWLEKGGPDARMVVIAGNGHVADRWGIPARADRKSGRSSLVVVQHVVDAPAAGEERAAPRGAEEGDAAAARRRLSLAHADYSAWWAPSGPPPKPAPAAGTPSPVPSQKPAEKPLEPPAKP